MSEQINILLMQIENELKSLQNSEATSALMELLKEEAKKEVDDKQKDCLLTLVEQFEEILDAELFMKR